LARKPLILFSVFFLFFISCRPRETWQTSTLFFFDTVCEINILSSPSEFEDCQKEITRIFAEIERCFSPGSEDLTSPLVQALFLKAKKVYLDSGGDFDITVGSLSRIWGFLTKAPRLPSPEEIKINLNYVGTDKLKEEKGGLKLPLHMELDWGGIAKGLAVDLASQALKKRGGSKGFINAGGDLYCWGTNPENVPWKIGIKHPRQQGFLGILHILNLGAATSGDYQRYFEREGIRYHHIFNPRTGYPAQGKQSVTVVGPEAAYCDALSTAIFVSLHPEVILKKYPDYGAIIVDKDGKIVLRGKRYSFDIL